MKAIDYLNTHFGGLGEKVTEANVCERNLVDGIINAVNANATLSDSQQNVVRASIQTLAPKNPPHRSILLIATYINSCH